MYVRTYSSRPARIEQGLFFPSGYVVDRLTSHSEGGIYKIPVGGFGNADPAA
jgi:hypothetical protein